MKYLMMQLLKFGVVGVFATVIDFAILTGLTELFHVHYLTSAAVAFIAATVFNYIASMRYVFTSRFGANEKKREFVIFVFLSVIGLGLNQLLMWTFVDKLAVYYVFAKILATVIVMGWNFVSRKIWIE